MKKIIIVVIRWFLNRVKEIFFGKDISPKKTKESAIIKKESEANYQDRPGKTQNNSQASYRESHNTQEQLAQIAVFGFPVSQDGPGPAKPYNGTPVLNALNILPPSLIRLRPRK